ncbi:short-chain dehydrogenase [Stagonosporopsis vannaccii]|nr:short-chain dehydrogenase [Stagonosporopsis vannaccii]
MTSPSLAPGLPEFSLKDKVVLVSGGARGLGLTQAEALLEAGAIVYALDRLPEPHPDFHAVAEKAKKELNSKLQYRQVDVRDVESLNKTVEAIASAEGRMDGLIAAAGIQQETTALEYTAEDANRMFEINITGVLMTSQAVAKQMIKFGRGGSIVLIASMSGTIANRGLICSAYNASKAGVIQLGRNLAAEWGQHNIRVNTLSPGYIVTQMVEELFVKYPDRKETWPTQNMLGRLSAPKEYRGAAVFLISEASSFMTGSDLRIDGGHAACFRAAPSPMSSATPTAVARYRPAILVLTGAAAAYGAYLLYGSLQAVPNDRLHRSNAVRRANPPRRPSRTTRIISRLESEVSTLGDYNILGLVVPLDPQNLITPNELRELLGTTAPAASEATIEVETARLYDVFLDRLLDSGFSNRPLAPAEIDAVARWVGARLPGPTTIPRAVERRTQRLNDARNADTDGAESVAGTDVSWNSDDDSDGEGIDPEGQTLQRTLYHIAEDRARQEGVIHRGITCNSCDEKPIRGTRWHCANCVDFDLCSTCEATNSHTKTHIFYKIRVPAPYLSLTKQEPLYPGKPHMMHHSVNSVLKRRLASETKMEAEEIEALWDQFTCLASTEWTSDPNKVGWALDRRAFNHAFVPRYNGFVAAPNLIYDRIFQYYDSDKNGLIGFEEWIKGIDGMHTTDMKVKARIVFNGYDINGDGYISRRDVLRVFRAYYAIEKEATRNFVAELTEELSVRNSMDTIRSGQPLGSAFPPNSLANPNNPHVSLTQKQNGSFDESSPVVLDTDFEHATRKSVIEANEIRQLLDGPSRQNAGDGFVQEAWARREFTLDEEEGLARPINADLTDHGEHTQPNYTGPIASEPHSEQSESRRSSKVHFQDEVNHKEWSSKSISKKPASEQWGGYEIPELEQDLGKEVLYQITQQAFNELLDPLFRAREDMSLAARSLRSERRKNAKAIDVLLGKTRGWGKYNVEIFRMGVFRFAKIVVELYCIHMSTGDFEAMRDHLRNDNREEFNARVNTAIAAAEALATAHLKPDDGDSMDAIAEWNAALVKQKLHEELLSAAVRLLKPSERTVSRAGDGNAVQASEYSASAHDPTMPQFRPNSAADLATNAETDVVEVSHRSSLLSGLAKDLKALEDLTDEEEHIRIDPSGPYFVHARFPFDDEPSHEEKQAQLLTTPTVTPPPGAESRDSEGRLDMQAQDSPSETPATPRPSHDFSQTGEETGPSSSQPSQEPRPEASKTPHFTNTPWLQTLYITTLPNGKRSMWYNSRHQVHTQNVYTIEPEPDQTAALIANLRRSAMNPESSLYLTLLASCEAVEQESRKRSGDGLLSFDEFEEMLRDGRLRFLESWMDWIMDGFVKYHVYFRMP